MLFYSTFEKLLIKRFLFSRKTDGYISIFSWFSIIGITIGVAAIIIVMSVMNGFREELTSRLLGINGHINIFDYDNEITKDKFNLFYDKDSDFEISPLTQTQAFLISEDSSKGVMLKGYDNQFLFEDHFLNKKIERGRSFKNIDEVVIGYALANRFNLDLNTKIKIAVPKTDNTIFGNIPRFKTMTIVGIFNLGMYEYDSNFIFTDKKIANKLLMLDEDSFNQIEIFTKNPNNVELIHSNIQNRIERLNLTFYSFSWKENNSALINALNVERIVMFLILTLIIVVASMNIISGLVIFVKEKNKDIGILKTIGLNNKSLVKIFLSIGLIIGLIGTSLGGVIGILFSLNIKSIQHFFENILNTELFSKEIYYLSNLPSKLNYSEIISVLIISIIISLIATTFPAYRSIKIDPIKSLKND